MCVTAGRSYLLAFDGPVYEIWELLQPGSYFGVQRLLCRRL